MICSARIGRETRFHATPAPLGDAIEWMTAVGTQWDEQLAALGTAVGTQRTRDSD